MNIPVHLENAEGYCRFCPRGAASLVEAVELVTLELLLAERPIDAGPTTA